MREISRSQVILVVIMACPRNDAKHSPAITNTRFTRKTSLLPNDNSHLRVRPAALKSAAATAGPLVRRHAENVFARLGECGGGDRLGMKHGFGGGDELRRLRPG